MSLLRTCVTKCLFFVLLDLMPTSSKCQNVTGLSDMIRSVSQLHPRQSLTFALPRSGSDCALWTVASTVVAGAGGRGNVTMRTVPSSTSHEDASMTLQFRNEASATRRRPSTINKLAAGETFVLIEDVPCEADLLTLESDDGDDDATETWSFVSTGGIVVAPRMDFMGETVRVVHDTWSPFFFVDPSTGDFDGIFYQVVMQIASRLNLSLEFVPNAEPGKWGVKTESGGWTGMMGMMASGEVDLSAAGFFRVLDREEVVDFSVSLTHSEDNLFAKRVQSSSLVLANYVDEFSPLNWLFILATSLAVMLAFLVLARVLGLRRAVATASSVTLRGLLYKGTTFSMSTLSVRILLLVHLLFATVIVLSYRSCMNGFLAISRPVIEVSNLADVASMGKRITFWGGGAMEDEFARADDDSPEGILYEKFPDDKGAHAESYDDVMRNVMRDEDYVGIAPRKLLPWYPREVIQVPNYVYKKSLMAFPFAQGSRFLKPFNDEIIRLKQDGVMGRLVAKHLYRPSRQECRVIATATSLSLRQVFTPFGLLVLGCGAGMLVSLLERMTLRRRSTQACQGEPGRASSGDVNARQAELVKEVSFVANSNVLTDAQKLKLFQSLMKNSG